jgi:seryl-tRNA synthetase
MTATEVDPYRAYRDELVDAGVLVPTGVEGLLGRSGRFEAVVDGVSAAARRAGAADDNVVLRFPPVFARAAFELTDYLRSFPDLTGSVHTFSGDDRDHARVLAAAEKGEDWSALLAPAEVMLCSAACHPLYPTQRGTLPDGGRHFDVLGWCFRHEPSIDPARMQAFRQQEFVFLGEPDAAQAHRDRWIERAAGVLESLGIDARAEVANDPFFGRAGRLLAANQREEALKIELVAEVASAERPTAVVSSNCHRDHFGLPFGIETADGAVAHTACVGFGLERVALALFRRHGLDPERWPASVRTHLWG